MNDEDLLQQAADCQTIYLDGIGAFRSINGVMRCVGFILESGAQVNLIISLTGAEAANRESRRVLDEHPAKGAGMWSGGASVAH